MTMNNLGLDYLFHHVFLPPQLPQSSDAHDGGGEQALLDRLRESVAAIREADEPAHYKQWLASSNSSCISTSGR